MPNFDAKIRAGYQDIEGLVLDCRASDLPLISGTHDGPNNSSVLEDSSAEFTPNALVGQVVYNNDDGSFGTITANTGTTVTATLAGGTDNDWDTGDAYFITSPDFRWLNRAPAARALFTGAHTGPSNSAILIDALQYWNLNQLAGCVVYNLTDGSRGLITGNVANQVTATLSGGVDNDWDANDQYAITTPRFGDPYQDVPANVPIVVSSGGVRSANFLRTFSHFMKVPLPGYALDALPGLAVAMDYFAGAAAPNQTAIGFANLEVQIEDPLGNYGYRHNGTTINGVGQLATGAWLLGWRLGGANADFWKDGVIALSGSASPVTIPAGDPVGYLGSSDGVADFANMALRGLQFWTRVVSPLEVDFAYHTISVGSDQSQHPRADVSSQVWTDLTGASNEHDRLNPTPAVQHRYILVTKPAGQPRRVQIAATVDGVVRDDTQLGGDLFSVGFIEIPGTVPAVFQDAGWSAVADLRVYDPGHYTIGVYRDNGGCVVLHMDVEEV